MADYPAFPADGYETAWSYLGADADGDADGRPVDNVTLQWDNEAWTAAVRIGRFDVEVVIRLSPMWQTRQILLFRDLEQPDLWLGTDGAGRWGEVNGAHRPDLDGTYDITIADTPFAYAVPIRRLPLLVGQAAELRNLRIDVETLGIVPVVETYERLAERRWRISSGDGTIEFDVDHHGLPLDIAERFERRGG